MGIYDDEEVAGFRVGGKRWNCPERRGELCHK
jgi:hypothetical protein